MPEFDIAVEGVSHIYKSKDGEVVALEDVSLEIPRGTLFSIVGPSGCGKSTLLRIMLGFLRPTNGTIHVAEERRRQGVAYIQQSAPLLPWRTLLQNASLGLEVRWRLSDVRVNALREEIASFGLGGFEDHLPGTLSGGMRQRVALIRALESQPALLFCDEPFAAIDFVTRLDLNTRFKDLCRVRRLTTVFVTHNIEEAIFLSDIIVVLSPRPGSVVKTYTPRLSISPTDAVESRKSPEFGELFAQIWNDLRPRGGR